MAKQNKHKECSYYHSREVELFIVFPSLLSLFWLCIIAHYFEHAIAEPNGMHLVILSTLLLSHVFWLRV